MNADTRRFLQTQILWIGISLAISLTLSFFLPFPLSLVAIIGVFILMNYYIRRWQMRRMGMICKQQPLAEEEDLVVYSVVVEEASITYA